MKIPNVLLVPSILVASAHIYILVACRCRQSVPPKLYDEPTRLRYVMVILLPIYTVPIDDLLVAQMVDKFQG
jgi:hypothetical protein